MINLSFIPPVAIIAVFSTLAISSEKAKMPEQMQIAAKEIRDKHYEERKEEEKQFIRAIQDEHEEMIEKKINETEKQREHIHHKKDSIFRKDSLSPTLSL